MPKHEFDEDKVKRDSRGRFTRIGNADNEMTPDEYTSLHAIIEQERKRRIEQQIQKANAEASLKSNTRSPRALIIKPTSKSDQIKKIINAMSEKRITPSQGMKLISTKTKSWVDDWINKTFKS